MKKKIKLHRFIKIIVILSLLLIIIASVVAYNIGKTNGAKECYIFDK